MLRLDPLRSERPLIAYFDIKSPYAYLAKDPTRALARELGIAIDWRPFTLDIPSYLGSAKLGNKGEVTEQKRSSEQWSGIKYAYFDCRRYANLRDMTVRGTVKIWDTRLVSVGMLWAKEQGDEVLDRYLDSVYVPFWKRDLDVEDPAVVETCLRAAGASTDGFADYVAGAGGKLHDDLQEAAFAAGIYGVPTYVVAGQRYFGREHLPRVRWHLLGEPGDPPGIAYESAGAVEAAHKLQIWIDFNSPASFAAIGPIRAVLARLDAPTRQRVTWHGVALPAPHAPPAAPADADRGGWHRVHRARYQDNDLHRYAPSPLHEPYAAQPTDAALSGLYRVRERAPEQTAAYVEQLLTARFTEPDGLAATRVKALLDSLSVDTGDMPLDTVTREQESQDFGAYGFRATPAFVLDGEPFMGAQHLPLIEARLALGCVPSV